jgi:aminocarboxymuconate-semialdehyde decarboxylase
MPSRRRFVTGLASTAAGILFMRSGLVGGAGAGGSAQLGRIASVARARRRQVRVGGQLIKTVDVHCHCVVPEAVALVPGATLDQALVLGPTRLQQMDAQGIDVQVLSINPIWYSLERDPARRLIDLQNQALADLCAAQPDRFVALASVALQYPDLAAEQLEHAVKTLGMRGAAIGGHVNADELSSPKFRPFWEKAQALDVVIFLHPQGIPELQTRFKGNGRLANVIGNPLETTIALSHLIFDGTLDQFPSLKICAAHGGGYLPSYSARSDHGCLALPAECTATLKKHPSEYLKQLYFDSLVFTSESLRHLVAECGASHIVIGTDYPYPWTTTAVDHVLNTPTLTDPERAAILGGNAARLLRLPA